MVDSFKVDKTFERNIAIKLYSTAPCLFRSEMCKQLYEHYLTDEIIREICIKNMEAVIYLPIDKRHLVTDKIIAQVCIDNPSLIRLLDDDLKPTMLKKIREINPQFEFDIADFVGFVFSGIDYNTYFGHIPIYKYIDKTMKMHGFTYKNKKNNVDTNKFDPTVECGNGLYSCREEHLYKYESYGELLFKISFAKHAVIRIGRDKLKADQIYISQIEKIET